jgi:hypothetical protein
MQDCPAPFTGYRVSTKFFHKNEGRYFVLLITPEGRKTTTSLARYTLSIKEGRLLGRNETADHIDNNRLNDHPDNLQVLSSRDNSKKYRDFSGIKHNAVDLICPICGRSFTKRRNQTHLVKPSVHKITVCSRKCSGILSTKGLSCCVVDVSRNIVREYKEKA